MVFAKKSYRIASVDDKFGSSIRKRPVLLFGLPFLLTIVAGSFALSELTATKYNVHDNKTRAEAKDLDDDWEIKRVTSSPAPGVTTAPSSSSSTDSTASSAK
ncbi:Cytochrome oxidase assembly [Lunasporangiospora selenospora]|uniref:Cytochrome c oxidase assembly protein COX16, mitochondrial n=1 Tax=Lunasporangiospora selenospora TaxID=979761 RepID=A0A9P6FUT2_9FUNG|nr:Cytochrome oxidase assembly [Lunasporangiospora selenospora]